MHMTEASRKVFTNTKDHVGVLNAGLSLAERSDKWTTKQISQQIMKFLLIQPTSAVAA